MSVDLEALNVDIDTRLTELWLELTRPDGYVMEAIGGDLQLRSIFATALRIAYGRGYIDALNEDGDGRRAELHRTHGYLPE